MAYVALSRVRSLSGVHLAAFDPKSIMVSVACLKEVNRLRDTYRKDLPLYVLPLEPKKGTKCKLTGTTHPDQPKAKKAYPTVRLRKPKKAPSPVRRHLLKNLQSLFSLTNNHPQRKFQRKGKELGQLMSNLVRNHIVVMMMTS